MISMKDRLRAYRMYQSGPEAQQYHSNDSRVDRYIFRDPIVPPPNPQGLQQNCLGYQPYQYPQLPRSMAPFPPSVHPTAVMNCPPHAPNPMALMRPEPPLNYRNFHERIHRMPPPPQAQTPQIQLDHNPPTVFYDSQNRPNTTRRFWPWDVRPDRRPANHVAEAVTVIALDVTDTLVVPTPQPPPPEDLSATSVETSAAHLSTLQQPNFAVMTPPASNPPPNVPLNLSLSAAPPRDQNSKKSSTISFLKSYRPQDADVCRADKVWSVEHAEPIRAGRERNIKVLKRRKSIDQKAPGARDPKITTNGDVEPRQDSIVRDQTVDKALDLDERRIILQNILATESNGNADTLRSDTTRASKKSVSGVGSCDENGGRKKANGQTKTQNGRENGDDVLQVYTILRKPEATTSKDELASEMSQLTIKGESGEVGTVLS